MEFDPLYILPFVFFAIAWVYASVGLGGGSAYTAVMALSGISTVTIPTLSLILNLIVTSTGSYNFIRHGHLKVKLLLPFLLTSIPMAYWGGSIKLPERVFYSILLASLVFVALRIYFWNHLSSRLHLSPVTKMVVSLGVGTFLGGVAGIVGIGGGIYLVPIIIFLNLGNPKQAAACGTVFVWLNSFTGLLSRLQYHFFDLSYYLSMLGILAVVAGGFLGSYLGATKFSPRLMEKILGSVILVAILFLAHTLLKEFG